MCRLEEVLESNGAELDADLRGVRHSRVECQMNTTRGVVRRQVERVDDDAILKTVHAKQSDFLRRQADSGYVDTKRGDCQVLACNLPLKALLREQHLREVRQVVHI